MLIIELTYTKSLNIVDQYLQDHRAFLITWYKKEIFIASGPKVGRSGGIILAKGSIEEIQNVIKSDPFFIHDVATYNIIQFEPNRYSQSFEKVL